MEIIVSAKNLRKKYGELEVVRGINFDVVKGECFGFLGPNGAGKTTTVRMIQCFSEPSGGELTVFGMDVKNHSREIKPRIGVVPQDDLLDIDLKVRENLTIFARYFGIPDRIANERADEALDFLQIKDKQGEKVDKLSGGMRRRLLIARALINKPQLLMFDEPTTGLDPQARHLIWAKVRELMERGVTIVLTTHYMEEASQLCERIAIMDRGVFIAEGRPKDLVRRHVGDEVVEIRTNHADTKAIMGRLEGCNYVTETYADTMYIFFREGCGVMPKLVDMGISNYIHRLATLEDVFLKLTGRELKE